MSVSGKINFLIVSSTYSQHLLRHCSVRILQYAQLNGRNSLVCSRPQFEFAVARNRKQRVLARHGCGPLTWSE